MNVIPGASTKFLKLDSGRRAELLPLASRIVCSIAKPLYLKGIFFMYKPTVLWDSSLGALAIDTYEMSQ